MTECVNASLLAHIATPTSILHTPFSLSENIRNKINGLIKQPLLHMADLLKTIGVWREEELASPKEDKLSVDSDYSGNAERFRDCCSYYSAHRGKMSRYNKLPAASMQVNHYQEGRTLMSIPALLGHERARCYRTISPPTILY